MSLIKKDQRGMTELQVMLSLNSSYKTIIKSHHMVIWDHTYDQQHGKRQHTFFAINNMRIYCKHFIWKISWNINAVILMFSMKKWFKAMNFHVIRLSITHWLGYYIGVPKYVGTYVCVCRKIAGKRQSNIQFFIISLKHRPLLYLYADRSVPGSYSNAVA